MPGRRALVSILNFENTSFVKLNQSQKKSEVKVVTLTDNTGKVTGIRVNRGDQTVDYHRMNRNAAEIFNHKIGDLHDFFSSVDAFALVMKNKRILDVGCGGGACVKDLAELDLNVRGLDLHLTADMKKKSHYIEGDAFHLPFRKGSFDTLLSVWSVFKYEPLAAIPQLLAESMRVLAPKGTLLISPIFDLEKTQVIRRWCEQNQAHLFQAMPSKALQIIKR